MGRKKTPTKTLKLRNSWRAKDREDIEVDPAVLECPASLQGEARQHWFDIVAKMSKIGILADYDWPKLYRLCRLWGRIKKTEPIAENEFAQTKNGNVIYNPAVTRLDKLWTFYLQIASDFGMGTSNRAGMGGVQRKEKDNDKSKFFRKNG